VPVSLEIDANGIDKYCQCQEDVVTVQVWPFEQIMQEYLLDPFCLAIKATWSMLVIPGENTSPLIRMTKKCLPATSTARHGMRTLPIPTPNSSYALRPTLTKQVRVLD
jgi:hypothetical protein